MEICRILASPAGVLNCPAVYPYKDCDSWHGESVRSAVTRTEVKKRGKNAGDLGGSPVPLVPIRVLFEVRSQFLAGSVGDLVLPVRNS